MDDNNNGSDKTSTIGDTNSLGMTKAQMEDNFHDEIPEVSRELLNKHFHWVKNNVCQICGATVLLKESL